VKIGKLTFFEVKVSTARQFQHKNNNKIKTVEYQMDFLPYNDDRELHIMECSTINGYPDYLRDFLDDDQKYTFLITIEGNNENGICMIILNQPVPNIIYNFVCRFLGVSFYRD